MLSKSSKWELGFVHSIEKFTISRFLYIEVWVYLPRNGIQIIRMWRVWTFQTLFTSLPLYRHDSNVTNYYLLIWIVIIYRNDFVVKVMFCNTKVDKNFQNKMYTCKVIIRWRLIFCLLFVISAHWHNAYFINVFTQRGKKMEKFVQIYQKKNLLQGLKNFLKRKTMVILLLIPEFALISPIIWPTMKLSHYYSVLQKMCLTIHTLSTYTICELNFIIVTF